MSTILRREFLGKAAGVMGAVLTPAAFGAQTTVAPASRPTTAPSKLKAGDVITLGRTGIKASRLAIGTGTESGAEQRRLGIEGLVRLLRHGFDQGVCWWDVADSYKTHPHVKAALKEMRRDQVTITSKTAAKDDRGIKADIERFRQEMGTDYIDIVLLHCMMDGNWPEKLKGAMDALSEAKQKGHVRAVGCSCHTYDALEAAADSDWVDVDLARINPFAAVMDIDKRDEVPQVLQILRRMHERGKAVYGMKILGAGTFKGNMIEQSLRFILQHRFVSAFVIGFSKAEHIDDIVRRIERVQ
ncbi:MAG: aldo/keto reductase [Phycisphaerae bacterium]|nr:aldo/keto reductase [Phycisphaerae bacterium]